MSISGTNRVVPVASLVLCPGEILSLNNFVNSLLVRHSTNGVWFDMFPLDGTHIQKYFSRLPKQVLKLLPFFTDTDVQYQKDLFVKQHAKDRSGQPLHRYVERKCVRYFHDLYLQLTEALTDGTCYQRIFNSTSGNYTIAKCHLKKTSPQLLFDVVRDHDQALLIVPKLVIDGVSIPLDQVKQYRFLVELNGFYYPLTINDYLTLEWLNNSNPEQYSKQPELLMARIIQKLKEQYTVNTNDLFLTEDVFGAPEPCIFLSEVSDTMLMLTPKWRYGGLLVEGDYKAQQNTLRQGKQYTIHREEVLETLFTETVRALHPNFAKQSNKFFYLTFAEAKKKQWFLKAYHALLEQNVELIGLEMLRHFRYSEHKVDTVVTIDQQAEELVSLKISIQFGKEKVNISELQKLLLAGQSTILLRDNTIGVFHDEWIEQYAVIIKHGRLQNDTLTVPNWIYLSLEQGELTNTISRTINKEWRADWIKWQDENSNIVLAPAKLKASLRPYQHKGFEWLVLLSRIGAGACLADDMGLGKTLQTIAFLCWRLEQRAHAKFIVVCPASLIYNWQQEFKKFAPDLSVHVYNGANRHLSTFVAQQTQALICSYGTLRSDVEELSIVPWDVVVADESHNVKNAQALATKALCQLKSNARLALSGTPVVNNTFDLYAQFNYLLPGLFGSAEFFKKEYAQPIDQEGNKEKVKALHRVSQPFVLRRTKEQVAPDLPAKTESILWCQMNDSQTNIYNKYKEQIKHNLFVNIESSGLEKNKLNVLQGILKLRQICCAPQLIMEEADCNDSVKLDILIEELSKLGNSKALVFSQFKGMLHMISNKLRYKGVPHYHFDGDTPIPARQEMVNAFQQNDNSTPVFLISLKSGNAGLNLTAADYVFLVDPWWNTAVQQQAIDRTHRIGQTKNVFAYKMICKDTIEEKILQLQEKKKTLSDELISAEDGFVKSLTESDVAFLFS